MFNLDGEHSCGDFTVNFHTHSRSQLRGPDGHRDPTRPSGTRGG